MDDNITSNVLKFAYDIKVFNTDGDKQHLQNDLYKLVKWSENWQMLFNFGKCKCLHTGHGNFYINCQIDQVEVFQILNGYKILIEICFSHSRKTTNK